MSTPPPYPAYPGSDGPTAASPDDPLVPADFGGWFQRVIGVIKRSFPQLALLQVITAVISAVVGAAATGLTSSLTGQTPRDPSNTPGILGMLGGLTLLAVLVSLVVGAFVQGGSVFVAIRDAAGRPATAADGLRFASGRVLALIGWGLLSGLIVIVGLILLVIPGLYLAVVIFGSLYGVVVVERAGIGRCFQLIRGRFWATAGRLVVAALIGGVYYAIVGAIANAIGGSHSATGAILQAVLMIPLGVAATGVTVVTYAELRQHERGTATPALAAELGG